MIEVQLPLFRYAEAAAELIGPANWPDLCCGTGAHDTGRAGVRCSRLAIGLTGH